MKMKKCVHYGIILSQSSSTHRTNTHWIAQNLLVSNWSLKSRQPHRVTSGPSSFIKKSVRKIPLHKSDQTVNYRHYWRPGIAMPNSERQREKGPTTPLNNYNKLQCFWPFQRVIKCNEPFAVSWMIEVWPDLKYKRQSLTSPILVRKRNNLVIGF